MRTLLLLVVCTALAGCETAPEEPTGQQLTASFAGACERGGFMAPTMDERRGDLFWAPTLAGTGIESKTVAFDRCMARHWNDYSAERAADQSRRAALAGALLQSGAFAPRPAAPVYQLPVQPAASPTVLPPINCTTTSGPNTGPFGVITSNTTCR